MGRFAVNLGTVDLARLEFLGYRLVAEDHQFFLFEDRCGDAIIVDRQRPFLVVDDVNDALVLNPHMSPITLPKD